MKAARTHLMNPGSLPQPVRPRSPLVLLVLLIAISAGIYLLFRSTAVPDAPRIEPTSVVGADGRPALERAFFAAEGAINNAPAGTAAEAAQHAVRTLNAGREGIRYVLERPTAAWQVALVPVEPNMIRVEAYGTSLGLPVLMTEVALRSER